MIKKYILAKSKINKKDLSDQIDAEIKKTDLDIDHDIDEYFGNDHELSHPVRCVPSMNGYYFDEETGELAVHHEALTLEAAVKFQSDFDQKCADWDAAQE